MATAEGMENPRNLGGGLNPDEYTLEKMARIVTIGRFNRSNTEIQLAMKYLVSQMQAGAAPNIVLGLALNIACYIREPVNRVQCLFHMEDAAAIVDRDREAATIDLIMDNNVQVTRTNEPLTVLDYLANTLTFFTPFSYFLQAQNPLTAYSEAVAEAFRETAKRDRINLGFQVTFKKDKGQTTQWTRTLRPVSPYGGPGIVPFYSELRKRNQNMLLLK